MWVVGDDPAIGGGRAQHRILSWVGSSAVLGRVLGTCSWSAVGYSRLCGTSAGGLHPLNEDRDGRGRGSVKAARQYQQLRSPQRGLRAPPHAHRTHPARPPIVLACATPGSCIGRGATGIPGASRASFSLSPSRGCFVQCRALVLTRSGEARFPRIVMKIALLVGPCPIACSVADTSVLVLTVRINLRVALGV